MRSLAAAFSAFGIANSISGMKGEIAINADLVAITHTIVGQLESPIVRNFVEGPSLTTQWNGVRSNVSGLRLQQTVPNHAARNRIQHESLKTCYRQVMEKPHVENENLKKIVKNLYRERAEIGSGSTADAARYEWATGNAVKNKLHLIKSKDYVQCLNKWLKTNSTASSGDRAAAENILLDLKDALGERQWYSKTTVPN